MESSNARVLKNIFLELRVNTIQPKAEYIAAQIKWHVSVAKVDSCLQNIFANLYSVQIDLAGKFYIILSVRIHLYIRVVLLSLFKYVFGSPF